MNRVSVDRYEIDFFIICQDCRSDNRAGRNHMAIRQNEALFCIYYETCGSKGAWKCEMRSREWPEAPKQQSQQMLNRTREKADIIKSVDEN
jgi:hypothetical protein